MTVEWTGPDGQVRRLATKLYAYPDDPPSEKPVSDQIAQFIENTSPWMAHLARKGHG